MRPWSYLYALPILEELFNIDKILSLPEVFHSLYHSAGKVSISRGRDKPTEVVDTSRLGSTIMETMLKEVSDFCNPVKRNNWSDSTRQQVLTRLVCVLLNTLEPMSVVTWVMQLPSISWSAG